MKNPMYQALQERCWCWYPFWHVSTYAVDGTLPEARSVVIQDWKETLPESGVVAAHQPTKFAGQINQDVQAGIDHAIFLQNDPIRLSLKYFQLIEIWIEIN